MLNSISFCLSVKLLISPSYLNEILAGYSNLGCRFFSFITLSTSCIPFWPEEFLLKDQLLYLLGSPCELSLYSIGSCFYHVTSTTGYCFCFGSIPSFFLELFLHWSPVAYWAPTDLGSSSFSVLSFCLFILFMGFSRQEYWSGLPFPSPVDHILSDLSTMTHPSWMATHGRA